LAKPQFYRDTVGCYIHFRQNESLGHDKMAPCTINAVGLGQYSAASGPIQAEDHWGGNDATRQVDLRARARARRRLAAATSTANTASRPTAVKEQQEEEAEDGFAVAVSHGGTLRFPHVRDLPPAPRRRLLVVRVRLAVLSSGSPVALEVHRMPSALEGGASEGGQLQLLGRVVLPARVPVRPPDVDDDRFEEVEIECGGDWRRGELVESSEPEPPGLHLLLRVVSPRASSPLAAVKKEEEAEGEEGEGELLLLDCFELDTR
jgi:hypothetical protein